MQIKLDKNQPTHVVDVMLAFKGSNITELAREMGVKGNTLRSAISVNKSLRLKDFLIIADILGFEIQAVKRD